MHSVANVRRAGGGKRLVTSVAATLLLIRHAAHIHLDRKLSGRMAGVPLSDEGHAQAATLARKLAAEHVQHILCSPLDRTLATARAIAASCSLPEPEIAEALTEIDMGDWTGRAFGTFGGDPAWRAWNEERATFRIPGGETMAEAQGRIVGFMREAITRYDGQTVAMVTHSDMIKAAVCHVLGMDLGKMSRFEIGPASVTRVVIGDWGGKILRLNEGVH